MQSMVVTLDTSLLKLCKPSSFFPGFYRKITQKNLQNAWRHQLNEYDDTAYLSYNLMTLESIVRAEMDGIHSHIYDVESLHGQINRQRIWNVDLVDGKSSMIGAVQLRRFHTMLTSRVAPEHTTNTSQQIQMVVTSQNWVPTPVIFSDRRGVISLGLTKNKFQLKT